MENQITLEQLASKFNTTVWIKGELQRIYLNGEGHNTKKMSTKTFIWQDESGEFRVSCKVECPSQPWQWCKSQEEQVKESVQKDIEHKIAQMHAVLVEFKELVETPGDIMVYVKQNSNAEPIWYTEEIFYEKFGCYPQSLFSEIPKIEYQPTTQIQPPVIEKEVAKTAIVNTDTPKFGVNTKVRHNKFGVGVVLAEDAIKVEVNFPEVGTKVIVKQFAKLETVESDGN